MLAEYKWLIIAVMWLLSLGGVGYKSWQLSADHQIAGQVKMNQVIADTRAAAQEGAAAAIALNKPINRYNQSVIQNETRIVPDYSRCSNSAVGLSAINAALEGHRAESVGGGVVPPTDPAK